jgi:hypothetical protein
MHHGPFAQHVSGSIFMIGTPTRLDVDIGSTSSNFSDFNLPELIVPFVGATSKFDQSVLVYFDGGIALLVEVAAVGTSFSSSVVLRLSGYLLDCTAIPCAPIAH